MKLTRTCKICRAHNHKSRIRCFVCGTYTVDVVKAMFTLRDNQPIQTVVAKGVKYQVTK